MSMTSCMLAVKNYTIEELQDTLVELIVQNDTQNATVEKKVANTIN